MENNEHTDYEGTDFNSATGKLEFLLTNDMLFHITMQKSQEGLIYLISSLLGMDRETIKSIHVENPIDYNKMDDGKEIILDLKVILNDARIVNIEIQVAPYITWTSRSVYYMSRMLDEQKPQEDYGGLKSVTQISITDFPLFKDHKEFFGRYRLINEKDGYLYSDLFSIFVLDLNAADLATQADIRNDLITWAAMFKAATWEEVREICKAHPKMRGVAETMYEASCDKKIRERILRHEKYVLDRQAMIAHAKNEGKNEGKSEGKSDTKELTERLYTFIKENPDKNVSEIAAALNCSEEDASWAKDLFGKE